MSTYTGLATSSITNYTLDIKSIYYALFFSQLTAIIAQGSLRSSMLEMLIQILGWGTALGVGLLFGWQYRHKKSEKLPQTMTNGTIIIGMLAFLYNILISGDLTSGLLIMISWLLVGLSFSLNQQRTLYFTIFTSTILLLYASSLSKSSSFIIYLIIFTLSVVIALSSNHYLSKQKQQFVNQTDNPSTEFPFKLAITFVTASILVLTAILYLFVPRPSALNMGAFPAGGGHYHADNSWPDDNPGNGKRPDLSKMMDQMKNKDPQELKIELEEILKEAASGSGDSSKLNEFLREMNKNDNDSGNTQAEQDENSVNVAEDDTYQGSQGGSSDSSQGQINLNSLVFYMEGNEPQYLRGNIYNYFDGLSWKINNQTKQRIERKDNVFTIQADLKEEEQYTVSMVATIPSQNSIYTPANTAKLQFPGNVIAKDNNDALFAPRTLEKGTFYSFKVDGSAKFNGRPIIPASHYNQPTNKELKAFKQLPKNLSDKFHKLAEKITNADTSTFEKAKSIERYLRETYQYSFDSIIESQGKVPLEQFLFDSEKGGHCEHFATSMVMLARAQNIPARLATGYNVSEFNPVTGYYEARVIHGHAWAEIWDSEKGWVTFEATPAYPVPKLDPEENAGNTSTQIEKYLKKRSDDAAEIDPTSFNTKLLLTIEQVFSLLNTKVENLWLTIKETSVWVGWTLLKYSWVLILAYITLYSSIHYLRYYIRNYRTKKKLVKAKQKTAQQQLEVSYEAMSDTFKLHKHPRKKGQTIQEYQQYLTTEFEDLSDEIQHISHQLNTALYSQKMTAEDQKEAGIKALIVANKIANYKFKIPKPGELQLQAIKDFFSSLTSLQLFNKKETT